MPNNNFSIHEVLGRVSSYYQDSGNSDIYCSILVLENGLPPSTGRVGPGIRLYAENPEQLEALHAWIVSRLGGAT